MLLTERTLSLTLLVTGIYHLATGGLALLAPGTFFDEIGRYGIENTHYVGDVGAFTFAFGIALLVAWRRPAWREAVLGVAALWYALHAINHAFDTGEARSEARGWLDTALLALGAAAAAYLAWCAARLDPRARPGRFQGRPSKQPEGDPDAV